MDDLHTLFVVPRLRIQNANAISSNLTWGFPAMSAFVGLMQALDRKVHEADIDLVFEGVGVVCHHYEAQATSGGFTRAFCLTRNPVDKTGETAAIVEEGRIHLEVSLVFAVSGRVCDEGEDERKAITQRVVDMLHTMRVAGGSIVPPMPGRHCYTPRLVTLSEDSQEQHQQFLAIKRNLLPGFALVLRDDLLESRFQEIAEDNPAATQLDAWLDLSRINRICEEQEGRPEWSVRRPPGWLVPVPVGYGALSELHPPGTVTNSRDNHTPFCFVESLYSIGQWVSPHRFKHPQDMLWYVDNNLDEGVYRLSNDYHTQLCHDEQEI